MALNQMGLGIIFTANDAMSGVVDRVARSFRGLQTESAIATAAVGAGLATAAAGLGVFVAGVMGLDTAFGMAASAAEFTAAIKRAGMVAEGTRGYTDALAASLREVAMTNAMDTGFDPTQIANGLENIAAMGFSAQQAVGMIRPALDLAAGGGISVESAASAMSAAMKVFGDAAGSPGDVADKLKGIADFTALQAKDLESTLGTVGRGAGMAKQNLDEMLISMGLVKNTGVDASVAASSVSSALVFMAKNAEKFKAIGVHVEDANGHFRNFGDVVLDVGRVMDGSVRGDAKAVAKLTELFQRFGVTAFQGVYQQLKTGVLDKATGKVLKFGDALTSMRKQMSDAAAEDRARVFADAMLSTFAGLSKRAEATMQVIKLNIGEAFEALLGPALKFVGELLRDFADILVHMSPATKKFAAGLFVVGSALTMLFGGALTLTGLALAAGAAMVAFHATLVPIMLIAAPIIAVLAALTAAFGIFASGLAFSIFNDIGGTAKSLQDTFDRWKLIFQSVIGFLSEGKLSGALADEFMKADKNTQDFVVRAVLFFEKIKAFASGFYEGLKYYMELAAPAINMLGDALMNLGVALGLVDNKYLLASETLGKGDFEAAGMKAARIFSTAFTAITLAITTAIDALTWFIDKVDMVIYVLDNMFQRLKYIPGVGGLLTTASFVSDLLGITGDTSDTTVAAPTASGMNLPPAFTPEQQAALTQSTPDSPGMVQMENDARAAAVQEASIKALRESLEQRILAYKTLTVQSVLDGRVIAESVMSIADEDRMSSFSGMSTHRESGE